MDVKDNDLKPCMHRKNRMTPIGIDGICGAFDRGSLVGKSHNVPLKCILYEYEEVTWQWLRPPVLKTAMMTDTECSFYGTNANVKTKTDYPQSHIICILT